MSLKDRFLFAIVPPIAYILIKLICYLQKIRYIGIENINKVFEKQGNAIIAFWHNRIFGIPYNYRRLFGRKKIVTLSSQSRDGEYSTRIQDWFGGETIRGSSSRGGTGALKKLVKEIHSGKDCAITPDGPRGPKYAIHDGAVAVAYLAGVPIVPVTYDCSRKKILKSWDDFIVPLPFGKMVFVFGEPIYPFQDEKRLSIGELKDALKSELMNITEFADREIKKMVKIS